MTEQRKSAVFAKEDGVLGSGTANGSYYRFPVAMHIGHSISQESGSLYETGNKMRIGAVYGPIKGSWGVKFTFDYGHLEPFGMFYDGVVTFLSGSTSVQVEGSGLSASQFTISGSGTAKKITDSISGKEWTVGDPPSGSYRHVFIKRNVGTPGHYIIREKTMHRMVGGSSDEITELYGCVPTKLEVSKSASSSEIAVGLDGIFVDQLTAANNLDKVDWYAGDTSEIAQNGCMFIKDSDTSGDSYIQDVDSFSLSMSNSIQVIPNICSRISRAYAEGPNQNGWSARTYNNQVDGKFLKRVFTGGDDPSGDVRPRRKGLAPMKVCKFMSYNGTCDSTVPTASEMMSTYDTSDRSVMFIATDSTVKSMTWDEGNNSLMRQSLSSVECNDITMIVTNDQQYVWYSTVESSGPTVNAISYVDNGPTVGAVTSSYHRAKATYTAEGSETTETDTSMWCSNGKISFSISKGTRLKIAKSVQFTYGTAATENIDGWVIIPYNLQSSATGTPTVKATLANDRTIAEAARTKDAYTGGSTSAKEYFVGSTGVRCETTVDSTTDRNCRTHLVYGGSGFSGTDYYLIVRPHTIADTAYSSTAANEAADDVGFLRVDVI